MELSNYFYIFSVLIRQYNAINKKIMPRKEEPTPRRRSAAKDGGWAAVAKRQEAFAEAKE